MIMQIIQQGKLTPGDHRLSENSTVCLCTRVLVHVFVGTSYVVCMYIHQISSAHLQIRIGQINLPASILWL
jgi:hypothetical protein